MAEQRELTRAQEDRFLKRLSQADRNITKWKDERVRLVIEGRSKNITWRRLADALDMTVEGVTRIVDRAKKAQ